MLTGEIGEMVRVRGLVQGVGFRPTVWRLAQAHGLRGSVANDGEGVIIHIGGPPTAIAEFVDSLLAEPPPLARIEQVERSPARMPLETEFRIASSRATMVRTGVVPDAATCLYCEAEIRDPRGEALSLPVHQLHALRPATVDHRGDPLRSSEHVDAVVPAVRGLLRRISRPGGSPLPCAADRLPGLRTARVAGTRFVRAGCDRRRGHAAVGTAPSSR